MTATVTKQPPMERYDVHTARGEWAATIALRGWEREGNSGPLHAGEIMINSDYGTYSASWGNMGSPIKRFLTQIDRGYILNRLAEGSVDRFDFDKTIDGIRKRLLEERRKRWMDHDEARAIWDEIPSDEGSEDILIMRLMDCDSEFLNTEPWQYMEHSEKPMLTGFHREVWIPFTDHLRTELANA